MITGHVPGLLPRFYAHHYPETAPRWSLHWLDNGVTRHINVEAGRRQYQAVWARRAYRAREKSSRVS